MTHLSMDRLFLLIFGGVLYSIGAVVYATRFPDILPNLVPPPPVSALPPFPPSPLTPDPPPSPLTPPVLARIYT
jgi:predicted membrane channel-forming protein YqfA (hemolysin III family)